jgi:hypothetical protein
VSFAPACPMNFRIASSSSRVSHWSAARCFPSGRSSGLAFPNFRAYAWLLATPRLKKTSCS